MSDQEQSKQGPEAGAEALQAESVLRLLGLARRAGKLEVGFSAVERLVQRHQDVLVIVTADMGPSQRHKTENWQVAQTIELPLTSVCLGEAMGRQKVAVVGLRDPGFAKGISKLGL